MATPTLTLINAGGLTDGIIDAADANTNWTNLTTAEPDIKVQGTNSMSGVTRTDAEDSFVTVSPAPVTAVGKVLRGWVNTTNTPYMGTEATNPYTLWCSDGTTQSNGLALFGSDTYPGGWFYYWQDMDDFTGPTLANVEEWGIEAGHDASSKNVINMWMDVLRYMDGYSFTGGTSGDKVTIFDLATTDKTSAYGITQESFETFFCTGTIQAGSGATTTFFEIDGEVVIFLDTPGALTIASGLYEISAVGTGCDCTIKNSVLRANGTGATTRFNLDFSSTDPTVTVFDNLIKRAGTILYATGQTNTGNTYDDCGQITPAGADIRNSIVKNYEGTTDTGAVVYNETVDPDGEFDGSSFTKGTAATHAIEFGTSIPSSITLRNIDFSGYNAADGQTDSTLYFADTAGTITVNIIGGSGTVTYKSAGATINIVQNPVTATITVLDVSTSLPIQNARVIVGASDATGDLGFEDSVTITRVSTTATVAHTGHPYVVGNKVNIVGDATTENEYTGAKTITAVTANTYDFTVVGTPTTPASGTITSTGLVLEGLTDINGQIADTRTYSVNQPIVGRARKSSASPYYKTGPFTGTINSTTGYDQTVSLILDE